MTTSLSTSTAAANAAGTPVDAEDLVAATGVNALAARRRRTRLMLTDAAMLALGCLVVTLATNLTSWTPTALGLSWQIAIGVGFVLFTVFALERRGLYEHRLGVSPLDDLGIIASGAALGGMILITGAVLLGEGRDGAMFVTRVWAFGTIYLAAGRAGLNIGTRRALTHGTSGTPTLIVGAGMVGQRLAERLRERPQIGLRPVGYLDKDPRQDGPSELPVLGASWDLEKVAVEHDVGHVIVTFSTAPHHVLLALTRRCTMLGIEVSIVPRLFEQQTRRISVEHVGGIPLLRAGQIDPKGLLFDLKYFLDRIVAVLGLIVLSPLLLGIAAAVRMTSPGPVLYRQSRVGLDGREFDLLKFRSMTGDASVDGHGDKAWLADVLGEEVEEDQAGPRDRRTPVGRVLRRTSLDELPQLLNIARGEMSFIGPRPERTDIVRAMEEHVYRYGDRHRVKSGLTGWAQVHGLRGETSLTDRVEWDNYYVENWSFWLDLKTLVLTIPAVLSSRGAQ